MAALLRTGLLFAGLTALFLLIGAAIGGEQGLLLALVVAIATNAFATGRDPAHAAVAASSGLLQMRAPEEVAGVMAHELSHVLNRDTLTMTVTATTADRIARLLAMAQQPGAAPAAARRGPWG